MHMKCNNANASNRLAICYGSRRKERSAPTTRVEPAGGAEIDLLLVWPDGKSWAIEVKRSLRPAVGRGFHSGCADLHPTRKLVVYPGNERLHVTADIDALPLATLARELAK